MRAFAPAAVLLLLAGLLAGCSQAPEPADTGADVEADGADGGRTARPGRGSDYGDEDDAVELKPIEILQAPLQLTGQGPVSFDVEVPAEVEAAMFAFKGSPTFESSGLRVELSGCGAYDSGVGFTGTTGGDYWGELCAAAEPGAQTVTVSGTLIVFDGTFAVTVFVPADDAEATAEPAA